MVNSGACLLFRTGISTSSSCPNQDLISTATRESMPKSIRGVVSDNVSPSPCSKLDTSFEIRLAAMEIVVST